MAGRWNFGMPKKGAALIERHKITVRRGGREWNGSWEVEGDTLHVLTAYGSRTAPAGKPEDRAARARALMEEILGDDRS